MKFIKHCCKVTDKNHEPAYSQNFAKKFILNNSCISLKYLKVSVLVGSVGFILAIYILVEFVYN